MLYIWCLEMNLFLFVLNFSNFSTVKETWAVIGLPAESGIVTCHTGIAGCHYFQPILYVSLFKS